MPITFKTKSDVGKVLLAQKPTFKYYNLYKVDIFKEGSSPLYKATVSILPVLDIGSCYFEYADAIMKNGKPRSVKISLNKRKVVEQFSMNLFKAGLHCNEFTQYYGYIDPYEYASPEDLEKAINEELTWGDLS